MSTDSTQFAFDLCYMIDTAQWDRVHKGWLEGEVDTQNWDCLSGSEQDYQRSEVQAAGESHIGTISGYDAFSLVWTMICRRS